VVSAESPVPHNISKTPKYTNCAMLQELTPYNSRTSRLCGMNSFRNWFRDGMCSALRRFSNVMQCISMPVSEEKTLLFKTEVITRLGDVNQGKT